MQAFHILPDWIILIPIFKEGATHACVQHMFGHYCRDNGGHGAGFDSNLSGKYFFQRRDPHPRRLNCIKKGGPATRICLSNLHNRSLPHSGTVLI